MCKFSHTCEMLFLTNHTIPFIPERDFLIYLWTADSADPRISEIIKRQRKRDEESHDTRRSRMLS